MYFILGTKFPWNEVINNCFNAKCALLGCNFDFLGDYYVVTARYLVVNDSYCSLPSDYWWFVTDGYHLLPFVTGIPTFSINNLKSPFSE